MPQPDMKRLPALLGRARREVRVDQRGLASAIGTSIRTISRWETGKHYPSDTEARDLAHALSNASGETWRALVDALHVPLDEMLDRCPKQREALEASAGRAKPAREPEKPSKEPDGPVTEPHRPAKATAIVAIERDAPIDAVPMASAVDLQGTIDDLIRAYAEEADVSPRRLRLVLGLLLGELEMMGVGVAEGRALVMHARRRKLP